MDEINNENLIRQLKKRYESNIIYTQISDNTLVVLHNSSKIDNDFQTSLDYVSEYKNTTANNSGQSAHIYQMVNQIYLHMRRTGIDQSIVLSGTTGSGKSELSNKILSHLTSLSSKSKLQTQILHIQTILDAFGHAKTSSHQNASQFGKYLEFQFNERGRMIGCKILNYLLNKKRTAQQQKKGESNFNIFYSLLLGTSQKEKQSLNLLTASDYNYTKSTSSPYNSTEEGLEAYEALKAAFRHFGLGKKYQTRIIQLLAAILNLGQLQFVDDKTVQEAAFVRDEQALLSLADSLGVDPMQLQDVLTYKTALIGKDVTTLILDAEQAAKQRDELASILYSLLFTWLIETMNSRLCVTDDIHNVIGVLDFPGWGTRSNNPVHLDTFCLNYANERLQSYILTSIFETHILDYRQDGLEYPPAMDYKSNTATVQLMDLHRYGIIDIVNNLSKKSSQNIALVDALNSKCQAGNEETLSFSKTDTGSKVFVIQHFYGTQSYQPNDFIESNRDALNADFVALFRGGSDTPPTSNSFLAHLFEDQSIITESHPKDTDHILNAQQNNKPNRQPSTKRSRSLKKKGEPQTEETKEKRKKTVIPTALAQVRSSLNDLFTSLGETLPWFIFCIQPSSAHQHLEFDSQFVRYQVETMQLTAITSHLKQYPYTNIFSVEDFLERYSTAITTEPPEDLSSKEKAQYILKSLGIQENSMLGNENVYLNNNAWGCLEDKLRIMEKEDQKKQRDGLRESRAIVSAKSGLSSAGTVTESEIISVGSNEDLLSNHKKSQAAVIAAQVGLPMPGVIGEDQKTHQGGYYSDDQRSFMSSEVNTKSETHAYPTGDTYSQADTTDYEMKSMSAPLEQQLYSKEQEPMTGTRKRWLWFVWFMTWWVPSPFMVWCGRMKRKDIQIAWREKLALCIIIFLMSGFIIWFLVFFGQLICPHQDVFSVSELQAHGTSGNAFAAIRGEVFDLTSFAPHHYANQVVPPSAVTSYAGKDITDLFPVQVSALCQGVNGSVSDYVSLDYHFNLTDSNSRYHDFRSWTDDPRPNWYYEKMTYLRKNYKVGTMAYKRNEVKLQSTMPVDMGGIKTTRTWAILNGSVYDLTYYLNGGNQVRVPTGVAAPNDTGTTKSYMSDAVVNLFKEKSGEDISSNWNALSLDPETKYRQEVCLRNLFYVGALDERFSPKCLFSEYLLLIVTVFLCLVIVFKFLAALQFRRKRELDDNEKFVICQVPCYTESEDELKKTIDSIATLKYDDKRKLLFVICDGMIVGGGNDRPTPRIVLDILGVDSQLDPEPLSFLSVGEGQKQHNMAKIYSGLYECRGHVIPYIVVSKVGKPSERQKPGNRGKRDSQLILMRFLNKIHYNSPMNPMELEIYHQIKNIIGVNPSFYEFVLMVDADTEVLPDGLNRLVSAFVDDAKIIGLCGETKLSNEKDTWVTMIQVYEYFISHYMIKAFESLFGSVTCLPGCFCMYRIRSPTKNQPLLISNEVIQDYHINKVDTLHKKNLLHLGEDRYLTTLILKHFPTHKTKFVSEAKCLTNAPDRWSVLLSQRRRWINSTIHNLGELVFLPQLCGFCCFSMRFVVMLDLISTLVQPAIVGYLVYLIYTLATSSSNVPLMSILTIAGVYGLQAVIFILHRKWEHIVWMIVSIFAIPVFSFYIPIYAYWHFDDFSWGNTRVVLGDKGKKKVIGAEEGDFDPNTIPTMTWEKYEEALYSEDWDQHDDSASVGTKTSAYSSMTYESSNNVNRQQQQQMVYQQAPFQPASTYTSSQYSYNRSANASFVNHSSFQNPYSSGVQMNPYQYSMVSGYSQQQPYAYGNEPPFQRFE